MQGHGPRPDIVSQYCLDIKTRQNAAENSDSEENSKTIEPASYAQKSRQNAAENSDSDSEGNSETTASSTQKNRQNAPENSDSEGNSEVTAAAAFSTQKNGENTAANSDENDSENETATQRSIRNLVENESDQPKAKKLKTHSEIEIHEIYHPPSTFKFPLRTIGGQNRGCQHVWLEKFQWLHYSLEKDSLFCYPCNKGQRSRAKISLMKERDFNFSLLGDRIKRG